MNRKSEEMKCPYRKKIIHHPKQIIMYGVIDPYDEEEYMECYGKDCPFYDNGMCRKVKKEIERGREE